MYIPSITTNTPIHKTHSKIMNTPQVRRTAAVVGLAAIGMIVAGKMMPSKNQTVVWGMSGELDRVNGAVETMAARERVYGLVLKPW
jgi:hypothetical protein